MQVSLKRKGLGKRAEDLLKSDEAFEEAINASNFIKRIITDPNLKKPTRVGSIAGRLDKAGDLTTRSAFNTIKKASLEARVKMFFAVRRLDQYNRLIAVTGFAKSFGRAVVFGGVAGGVAGQFLNRQE